MKLNIKTVDKIVGIFILLAIFSLAFTLIILGLNQRWFKQNIYFYSEFKSASNLSPGMSITLSGFEIGKVDKITLDADKKIVRVDFYIYEEYYAQVAFEHSIIELVSSPIGLGSGLVFHPAVDKSVPAPPGTHILAYNSDKGLEYVNSGLVERAPTDDSIGALIAQVNPILQQIPPVLFAAKNVLVGVEEAMKGTRNSQLGKVLYDLNNLVVTVNKSVTDIDNILLGKDTGPVGITLANVSEISEGANGIIADVDTVINEVNLTIKRERGKIEELMSELKVSLSNINGIIESVGDLTADPTGLVVRLLDPQGSIKTFLDDDNALFNSVEEMLKDFEAIVNELKNFAQFVTGTSPQIAGILDEGKAALDLGQDVLEGLKNNPLLKSGISEKRDQEATTGSYRDAEF